MKRAAIAVVTAALLALTPGAAAAKKPDRAKDRGAKVERKAAKRGGSAQQRCRDERRELGAAAFAARYGKPRTKGSAKARARVARAAFGRCVRRTAKELRAEHEAAEAQEDAGEDLDEADEDELADEDGAGEDHSDDAGDSEDGGAGDGDDGRGEDGDDADDARSAGLTPPLPVAPPLPA